MRSLVLLLAVAPTLSDQPRELGEVYSYLVMFNRGNECDTRGVVPFTCILRVFTNRISR